MKYIAIIGGAVLALGAALAAAFFLGRDSAPGPGGSPKPSTSTKPVAATPSKVPTPPVTPLPSLPPATPEAVLEAAKQLAQSYQEIQADTDAHPPGSPAGPDAAVKSRALQTKAAQASSKLQVDLRRTPAAWKPLIDFLVTVEDVRVALKIVERIRASADVAVETRAIEMLKTGQAVNARRIGASFLGARKTPAGVDALAAAVDTETDAVVRLAAVKAVADQVRHPGAQELSDRLKEILKKCSESDADESIRDEAKKALAVRPPMTPPPRPHKTPFPPKQP